MVKTSNKKGSNLLIYKNDKNYDSLDEEEHNYGTGNNLDNIHTIVEAIMMRKNLQKAMMRVRKIPRMTMMTIQ